MTSGHGRWERIDVSAWEIIRTETSGSSTVEWLEEPGTGREWLHKNICVPRNKIPQGEDWAEVVTTQVAKLLMVPCAETQLCIRNGTRGSLSLSVTPRGMALHNGMVALQDAKAPGYIPHVEGQPAVDPQRPDVKRPGHTLDNIHKVLEQVEPPDTFAGPRGCNGFDVFAGYLILDALVANRDRHEENWAILRSVLLGGPDRLAPSYDHGGTLGYNLPDAKREELLKDPEGLAKWAKRGTAWRFEHDKSSGLESLVDTASRALSMSSPPAVGWWRQCLKQLDLAPLQSELESVNIQGMSEVAVTFAVKLLDHNLGRLRHAICDA